ncbi:MAG: DUF924 family protein, partial [Pseudomonadota bacterium]
GESSAELDARIHARLGKAHEKAADGQLDHWREAPKSALALCILLDQVPRNCFRGTARAFATDSLALRIASEAIDRGFDQADELTDVQRVFFYLPLEHAEDLAAQKRCLSLMSALDQSEAEWATYAQAHLDIVETFGRFPHRNRALGRSCTMAERQYLRQVESDFAKGGTGAVFGLDHIILAVPDLDEAHRAWSNLGFTLSNRGFHEGWATANHCIMLGDHYVELMGRVKDGIAPPGFDECLAGGGGLYGIAFGGADGPAAAAFFTDELGIGVEPIVPLSRKATGPVADQMVSFELVRPVETEIFGPRSFVCLHKTRDLVWQPALIDHPNGATEITSFTAPIARWDDGLPGRYEALVGPTSVTHNRQSLAVDLWGIGAEVGVGERSVLTIKVTGSANQSVSIAGVEVRLSATP